MDDDPDPPPLPGTAAYLVVCIVLSAVVILTLITRAMAHYLLG